MCVIAVKPYNESLLSQEQLDKLFKVNSDGAGFMYVKDRKVRIRKGFMTIEKLYEGLDREKLTHKDLVIYHFRIGTSGGVSPQNTHPFPISNSLAHLKSLSSENEWGVAHNGILTDFIKEGESDTINFVKEILSDRYIKEKLLSVPIVTLIGMAVGNYNKFVIVHGSGKYVLLGDWHDKNNILYSNLNWELSFSYSNTNNTNYQHMSKRMRKRLLRSGFALKDGIWQKLEDTNIVKEDTTLIESSMIDVPIGSVECPKCKSYIFSNDVYCKKCGIFLNREDNFTSMCV